MSEPSPSFYSREYAWYSPELNVIVFQTIMTDCYIAFLWDNFDLHDQFVRFGPEGEPMQEYLWFPLGEV